MITKIVEFVKSAALYARNNQYSLRESAFKAEQIGSVVTETDLTISQMFKEFVEKNFSDLNFVIIDEESLGELGEDKFAAAASAEYQFVIDPIDGTHPYALQMPDYAISVGIMKNCRPYLGCICLPALGELLYFDGQDVHWQRYIYEIPQDIIVRPSELTKLAVIFNNEWFVKINEKYDRCNETIVNYYSCIVHFFYMITNRAKGYYFGSYIWDMAASWPMLQHMGFEFYDYENAQTVKNFSNHTFNNGFLINRLHIVCKKDDFNRLKEIAKLRDWVKQKCYLQLKNGNEA